MWTVEVASPGTTTPVVSGGRKRASVAQRPFYNRAADTWTTTPPTSRTSTIAVAITELTCWHSGWTTSFPVDSAAAARSWTLAAEPGVSRPRSPSAATRGLSASTRSRKMLALARQKSRAGVAYVRATAEAIPLDNEAIDTIFISMAFHHFADPSRVAQECRRVLAPDGRLLLRAGTKDRVPAYPYVPFFPTSVSLLDARLPAMATIEDTFRGAGFRLERFELVVQEIAPTLSAYADKLAAGGDSILASLSASDLRNGLVGLRDHAAAADPLVVREPIDFFVFRRV